MNKISIIIPVLNEARCLAESLARLQPLRREGHEIVVVDGGSTDETVEIARLYSDKVLLHERGRAIQMNAGADKATGDIFIFLHADTELPVVVDHLINLIARSSEQFWGYFRVRLSGHSILFRIIEFIINHRSRLSGIGTGDQTIFISRGLFREVGGFDRIPLMEDIAICKKLKKLSKPTYINMPVITSSRKWESHGIFSTILLMWRLRLAYSLGVNPALLEKKYYG